MVKVFSFCLYGPPNPRYYPLPIVQNVQLIAKYYPDWKVYIYVSPEVDIEFLHKYSNVVVKQTGKMGVINRIERLFAVDDEDVEIMFVRDADSRVHWKDRWAINDFLSKPQFVAHVIRDHKEHNARILAGMWGMHKSAGMDVQKLFEMFQLSPIDLGYGPNGVDQSFLGTYIYPQIKNRLLVHFSNDRGMAGEHVIEFPFHYTDTVHCGKVEGDNFVDHEPTSVRPGRKILINGRVKI